ncbi:MAG: PQQ-dependent sugar dehydrogenase [Candidatus Kapaibacterium sp.]
MPSILRSLLFLLTLALPPMLTAQSGKFDVVEAFPLLTDSFNELTDIQNAGDGSNRLFVSIRPGIIYSFVNNSTTTTASIFLDIRDRVTTANFETGLLGFAFHPNFAENGYFYVHYLMLINGKFYTRISRFTVDAGNPAIADTTTEQILFDFQQPGFNHNGGQLAFGPDGYLYIGLGDGIDPWDPLNSGQDLRSILGTILRIDVDRPDETRPYSIPPTNPFAGNSHYRNEIYAWGLRNPWRFSFDPPTGRLWAGDVGQYQREEVDIVEKGGNYGWRMMEGYRCGNPTDQCDSTGLISPVWEYRHNDAEASVTGGFVYRGTAIPRLQGIYIYADFPTGRIWGLDYKEKDDVTNSLIKDTELVISSFGIDEGKELFIGDYVGGRLYRFADITGGVNEKGDEVYATLNPAIPNPVNAEVVIPYEIAERSAVTLILVNSLGERIATLVNKTQRAGEHQSAFDVSDMPEGIYYIQLSTGSSHITRKLTVIH